MSRAEPRRLALAGPPFEARHRQRLGPPIELDDLVAEDVPPELLPLVQATWQRRVRTEFRSIQIMTRFLTEVTGAGDPLEIYAGVTELLEDEIRHTELCLAVCRRLGVPGLLPDPVAPPDSETFLRLPMAERALSTALTMLGVNETVSVALISDLLERCDYPPIRRVLQATVEDEATHGSFGWDYISASLARFDRESYSHWRALVARALEPHQTAARQARTADSAAPASGPLADERLLARFGLLSEAREVWIFERTWDSVLRPRLGALGLL